MKVWMFCKHTGAFAVFIINFIDQNINIFSTIKQDNLCYSGVNYWQLLIEVSRSPFKCSQSSPSFEILKQSNNIIRQMSIYSGFPTRKDETKYNDLLSKLILMMQQHLLETIQGQITQKKVLAYTKVITKMKDLEQHKYLPPKFTELLDPLCQLIGMTFDSGFKHQQAIKIDEKHNFMSLKSQSFAQSANKQKLKPRLVPCLQNLDSKHIKKASLWQEQRQSRLKSTTHLKQRKFKFSSHSGQGHGVQVAATYDEEMQAKVNASKHIMRSQPIIISNKIKNNLRYRAFQALNQAQQGSQNRNRLLRGQLRQKLKVNQEHSQS